MNIEYILKEHFKVDKVCFKSGKFTKQGAKAYDNLINLIQHLSLFGVKIDAKEIVRQLEEMTSNKY